MDKEFLQGVLYPIIVAGGSVLFVSLIQAAVRQIGSGAKITKRLAAVEAILGEERKFKRTVLTVLKHQNESQRVTLAALKAAGFANGNATVATERLDMADEETQTFLVEIATGGKA